MDAEKIPVIWNTRASGSRRFAGFHEELRRRSDLQVFEPGSRDQATQIVAQCVREEAPLLIVAGGDGTTNDAVQVLASQPTETQLGILPLGTGNDFCRTAAIPLHPEAAFRTIMQRRVIRADAVLATTPTRSLYYLNMATGGNTGRYANLITDEIKVAWGPFAYLRGAVDVLTHLETFDLRVELDDGSTESLDALNIFVANGRTSGGGLMVAPDASVEDGLLDLVIICDCEPLEMAVIAAQHTFGDYRDHPAIYYRTARRISIDSTPPVSFSADGDALSTSPVTFETLPGAISVVVGEEYANTVE